MIENKKADYYEKITKNSITRKEKREAIIYDNTRYEKCRY